MNLTVLGYKTILLKRMRRKSELKHHGIKGMKWGIRNGPPYPIHRDSSGRPMGKKVAKPKKDGIIKKEFDDGKISIKINKEHQGKHIKNGPRYIKGRSYLFGGLKHAERLFSELSMTGNPIMNNGVWSHKERVSSDTFVGVYISPVTGEKYRTKNAIIVYSKTGWHIYPAQKGEKNNDNA